MPRKVGLIVFGWVVLLGLPAQDFSLGVAQPQWTLRPLTEAVVPGRAFTVTVEVTLPPGYYQDVNSPFLSFEPLGATVVSRASSTPQTRDGKESFTGTFTLTRTVLVEASPSGPSTNLDWTASWQICQVDGICLLPAQATLQQPLTMAAAPPSPGTAGLDFWGALAGAFLGGLLLNLMPCVFPVLALKAVGVAASAGLGRRERRRDALLFAAGGWATVMVLGLITAAFSLAGQRLDWGFTFQQPVFVWGLLVAFWVFALQLWGVWAWSSSPFTVTLSAQGGRWRPLTGGALLVLTAAPCTAPLLGPALGFAFAQPPAVVVVFFAVAGAGLVLPLLLLSFVPAWSRWLPRPGPWMVVIERVAGFLLAGTVVYLLWVFTRQTSEDLVWPALVALGLIAAAFSVVGRFPRSAIAKSLALVVVLGALAAAWGESDASATPSRKVPPGWIPYSSQALEKALAAGQPVLVDATAAWCATCQVNELAVLHRPDVSALLEKAGVVRLVADYTRPDPAIREWLASVGRAGLPVYALYRPGQPPYFFPELLTDENFTNRISSLTGAGSVP